MRGVFRVWPLLGSVCQGSTVYSRHMLRGHGGTFRLQSPPVRFVQLTLLLQPYQLSVAQLVSLAQRWRDQLPSLRGYPYGDGLAIRFPTDPEPTAISPLALAGNTRLEFETESGGRQITLQPDRISCAWDFHASSPSTYPGFDELRAAVTESFQDLRNVTALSGQPIGSELGYFNHVARTDLKHLQLLPLHPNRALIRPPVSTELRLFFEPTDDGCRLMVGLDDPVTVAKDSGPVGQFVIFSGCRDAEDRLGGLARAHDRLIEQFRCMTTEEQRAEWGESWV